MASMDDLTTCSVCFELFDINIHVPRILPCSHSFCHVCIERLLNNSPGILACPECRESHNVGHQGARTFPQNKYILTPLQRKQMAAAGFSPEQYDAGSMQEKCKEHGDKFSIFCLSSGCMIAICIECLEDHKHHEVSALAKAPLKMIEKGREQLSTLKARLGTNKYVQLDAIETARENAIKMIEEKFEKKKARLIEDSDESISFVKEKLAILDDSHKVITSMKETEVKVRRGLAISYLMDLTENINMVVNSIQQEIDNMSFLQYTRMEESRREEIMEKISGKITKMDDVTKLPKDSKDIQRGKHKSEISLLLKALFLLLTIHSFIHSLPCYSLHCVNFDKAPFQYPRSLGLLNAGDIIANHRTRFPSDYIA